MIDVRSPLVTLHGFEDCESDEEVITALQVRAGDTPEAARQIAARLLEESRTRGERLREEWQVRHGRRRVPLRERAPGQEG